MNAEMRAPRPRQRRRLGRRAGRAGRPAAGDHRPRARRPAHPHRRRPGDRGPERRDLQPRGAARRARGRRAPAAHALGHRGAGLRLPGVGPALRRAPARHVRPRAVGRGRAPARARPRPLRHQAAVPRRGRRRAGLRLRAQRPAPGPRLRRGHRPRGARGLPGLQLDPGAADHLPRPRASCRPATCWCASAGHTRIERFARPTPVPAHDVRRDDEATLAAELREALRDSVRAHLVSDVPVGVLLSGGVDSSVLCALAAQESGEPVQTFSIGFQERSFNELDLARSVAERYRTDHHELIVRPDAAELLPEIVASFDEPFGDSSALPTFLVCRLAGEHVKVALSGEGGDELFGGYETYVADLVSRPRPGPGGAAGAAAGRAAAELLAAGLARVPGQAVRARRPPAPARAPPRLEGDLRARGAGRAPARRPQRPRPARRLPRPLRRDRRAPSRWRGCRTWTSASTSSTTCWSRPTA